jgi:hypothetical protein
MRVETLVLVGLVGCTSVGSHCGSVASIGDDYRNLGQRGDTWTARARHARVSFELLLGIAWGWGVSMEVWLEQWTTCQNSIGWSKGNANLSARFPHRICYT